MCIHIKISIITSKVKEIEAVDLPQSYYRQTKQFCPNHQVSNFHGFLQIPVVFSCWPEASMASSWLCILLIPLLITLFSLFKLICFCLHPP